MSVLDKLLTMTINGSVLILLILLIRTCFAHRMTRNVILALWGSACFILVFPVTLSIPKATENPINEVVLLRRVIDQPVDIVKTHAQTAISQPVSEYAVTPHHILLSLYVIGFVAFGLLILLSYRKSQQIASVALPIENATIKKWEASYRRELRRALHIQQSDRIASPVTSGIASPKILLPTGFESSEEEVIQLVLAHEMVHIRRWDNLKKLLLLLVLMLHWFNPLVWVMYHFCSCDLEIACDERTLNDLGSKFKKKYAYTLIQWNVTGPGLMRMQQHFSKNPVKERVEILLTKHKKNILLNIAAVAVVAGIGATLVTKQTTVGAFTNQTDSTAANTTASTTANKVVEHGENDAQPEQMNRLTKQEADYTFEYLEKYQENQDRAAAEAGMSSSLHYEAPVQSWIEEFNVELNQIRAEAEERGISFVHYPHYINVKKSELPADEIALWEQLVCGVAYLESNEWLLLEHPDYANKLEQHRITYSDGSTLKTSFVFDSELGCIVRIDNEDYTYGEKYGIEVRTAVDENLEPLYEISVSRYGFGEALNE